MNEMPDNLVQFPEGGKDGIQNREVEEKKARLRALKDELAQIRSDKASAAARSFESDYWRGEEVSLRDRQTELQSEINELAADLAGAFPDPKESGFANPDDR